MVTIGTRYPLVLSGDVEFIPGDLRQQLAVLLGAPWEHIRDAGFGHVPTPATAHPDGVGHRRPYVLVEAGGSLLGGRDSTHGPVSEPFDPAHYMVALGLDHGHDILRADRAVRPDQGKEIREAR